MNGLGWLSEYSEVALRSALRVAGGGLDRLPIELTGTNDLSRPTWASVSATVDRRFLCKFAFSEPTAVRVWHEARVLKLLADLPAFDVPEARLSRRPLPDRCGGRDHPRRCLDSGGYPLVAAG